MPQTMKLQGAVDRVPVEVLIDSGATDNFVDSQLVRRMGWEVEDTPRLTVKMGDGYRSQAQGLCKNLELSLNGYQLNCSPQLFKLGGPDTVLGIEWLKTLGDTIVNWQTLTMSFWSGHQWVKLQGVRTDREILGSL